MALQDKKIMPPPWLAHREIERYSIGWRMGYGEDYIYRCGDWLDILSPEAVPYTHLFPLPKGQESNVADFAVILKMDNDGDTVVYSPIPLPHLENQ